MNKLIIISAFFLVSCASSNYKRRDIYHVRYTVREYYYPSSTEKQTMPSEKWKAKSDSVLLKKKVVKKKRVILSSRLDCEKVFKEINQCMR